MKDKMNLALVNFQTNWGDKEANLASMKDYIVRAGENGADMIVFPETALTGYANDAEKLRTEKMHVRLAESVPGPTTCILGEYAKKYNMFIVFGLAEAADNTVYNSAAIIYPDGHTDCYRKIHLPFDEAEWAVNGNRPVIIDSEFGPIGISICYDTYCFPELIRYYRAMGCRMVLNVTACPENNCTAYSYRLALPAYAFVNYMYIASSNIWGKEKGNEAAPTFHGGSSVIGPDADAKGTKVYLGEFYDGDSFGSEGLIQGEIDLSVPDEVAQIPVFRFNPASGEQDWRGDLYAEMFKEARDKFKDEHGN